MLELWGSLSPGEYTYLEGRCLHYGGSMPYLPFLDITKLYFNIQDDDKEQSIKNKVKERIVQLDEKLINILPSLQELLSVTVDNDKYLQIDPQQRKSMTFEAIMDLFIRESQQKPLVLVVEDLHWIDKTSEDFLDNLIGGMANTSILLLLLYRPEYSHTWGSKSYYS